MLVAAIYHEFPMDEIDVVGNMSLNLFLAMALAGLQLWLLLDLALPMIVTLAVEVVIMFAFSNFILYHTYGGKPVY